MATKKPPSGPSGRRDPKAPADPPARPVRKDIGAGTTPKPRTLPARKAD